MTNKMKDNDGNDFKMIAMVTTTMPSSSNQPNSDRVCGVCAATAINRIASDGDKSDRDKNERPTTTKPAKQ